NGVLASISSRCCSARGWQASGVRNSGVCKSVGFTLEDRQRSQERTIQSQRSAAENSLPERKFSQAFIVSRSSYDLCGAWIMRSGSIVPIPLDEAFSGWKSSGYEKGLPTTGARRLPRENMKQYYSLISLA